jgi:hypothetical protein
MPVRGSLWRTVVRVYGGLIDENLTVGALAVAAVQDDAAVPPDDVGRHDVDATWANCEQARCLQEQGLVDCEGRTVVASDVNTD